MAAWVEQARIYNYVCNLRSWNLDLFHNNENSCSVYFETESSHCSITYLIVNCNFSINIIDALNFKAIKKGLEGDSICLYIKKLAG